MRDRTLSDSAFSHVINAPIERVDIADWLFHLPNPEYRRCCPTAHIAAGTTTTDDERPMTINVEMMGDRLVIQQYVAEVADPGHCRMVSISDVFSPQGRTTSHVVWDLSVERLDEHSCEYINHVTATATDEFLGFIDEHAIPFEQAAAEHDAAAVAHNEQETPLFAHSIERRALSSRNANART
jgi:hypothetical protein